MRSMCGVFAVLAICGLASAAAGAEPCCGSQAKLTPYESYAGYAASACAAPAYGMVPGCCEFPPSCCDHVWDGYCQERCHGACGFRRACCGQRAGCRFPRGMNASCGAAGCECLEPGCASGGAAADPITVGAPIAPGE